MASRDWSDLDQRLPERMPPLPGGADARTVDILTALERAKTPGCAVALIRAGVIERVTGHGVTAPGGAPVDAHTIFQACSISKPVAAVAALRLVEQGALALDADIHDVLRSWALPAVDGYRPRVTLRQLLAHTAALTDNWYPGYARSATLPTLRDTLLGRPPANTPPVVPDGVPGVAFRYSGSHYSVLQQLLEDVTGQPFVTLLHALVLDPLGMADSSYDQRFPETRPGGVALGFSEWGEPLAGGWRQLPEMAAAGLWTTPADLTRLACDVWSALQGSETALLRPETVRAMLTAEPGGWGLGWQLAEEGGRATFGHGGSNVGYRCRLVVDRATGDGLAVMTNGEDGIRVIEQLVHAAGLAPLADQLPAVSLPDPRTLVGRWRAETGARLELLPDAAGLALGVDGQPPRRLVPREGRFVDAAARIALVPADDGGAWLWLAGQRLTLTREE